MLENYKEVTEKLKTALNEKRYIHTLGVAYTAASLAMRYHADVNQALLAGLLHDCAKCFSEEERFGLCKEGGIELSESEINNPELIHAKLGVYIAVRDYGVDDGEILDAIKTHTTGQPEMSLLQKIIFAADLIEPGRRDDLISEFDLVRSLAFTDIDRCIYLITKKMLKYLHLTSENGIDPETQRTYDYYKELIDAR